MTDKILIQSSDTEYYQWVITILVYSMTIQIKRETVFKPDKVFFNKNFLIFEFNTKLKNISTKMQIKDTKVLIFFYVRYKILLRKMISKRQIYN